MIQRPLIPFGALTELSLETKAAGLEYRGWIFSVLWDMREMCVEFVDFASSEDVSCDGTTMVYLI